VADVRRHVPTLIGVGAQSTLRGHQIFARKICIKNSKIPEFYMILARKIIEIPEFLWYLAEKIYQIPEFYMIFALKMPEFYVIIARKIFSRILGGHVPPVFYAYAHTCPPVATPPLLLVLVSRLLYCPPSVLCCGCGLSCITLQFSPQRARDCPWATMRCHIFVCPMQYIAWDRI